MEKIKINLPKENISRLKKFVDSNFFKKNYSKSEMWKQFGAGSKISFQENHVILEGLAGLYFFKTSLIKRSLSKLKKSINNIFFNNSPIFLSHQKAFDLTMNNKQSRGKKQLDFNIKTKHKIFRNFKEIKKENLFKNFDFDYYETKHYYLLNVLRTQIDFGKINNILEIGGGSGHFSILINSYHKNVKTYIDVDIPETIIFNICFLMYFFPEKRFLLPNEANGKNIYDYNFVYLTPEQINSIKEDSIDLSINCASFGEMIKKDISIYFDLIQQSSKNNAYFFNHNRVHKNPEGQDEEINKSLEPNIFSEYPYRKNNILIYDICRWVQMLEKDPMMMRLEQIKKND